MAEGYCSEPSKRPKDFVPLAKKSTSHLNSRPWLLIPVVVNFRRFFMQHMGYMLE